MKYGVSQAPSETKPTSDLPELPVSPTTFLEWRDVAYAALQRTVDDHWQTRGFFADEVGVSNGECSRRLRHAPDEKTGRDQLAYFDYIATLAMKHGALEQFCAEMLREKGYRVELQRGPTAEERADALATLSTDKVKRAEEQRRGWPAGSLG